MVVVAVARSAALNTIIKTIIIKRHGKSKTTTAAAGGETAPKHTHKVTRHKNNKTLKMS